MTILEDGTRDRILASAGEIFADLGYEHATIREISRHAGVNLAAVNYHFGDKKQLYRDTFALAFQNALDSKAFSSSASSLSATENLIQKITVIVLRNLSDDHSPWQARLLNRETMQPTEFCQDLVCEIIRPRHLMIVDLLRELSPVGTPTWQLQQIAFSIIGQAMFYRTRAPLLKLLVPEDELDAHFHPEQIAEQIIAGVLATLDGLHIAANSSNHTASPSLKGASLR